MTFGLLTPGQIAAYLEATGWERCDIGPGLWSVYRRGDHQVRFPKKMDWGDYGRRVEDGLKAVAFIEGRPSPEMQVLRDIVRTR